MTNSKDFPGDQVGTHTYRVRADNPSPMTLEGTNTWIFTGESASVVVDPGPDVNGHLGDILSLCSALGTPVSTILLTHDHADHAAGAESLSQTTGAPVLSRRNQSLLEGRFAPAGEAGPVLQVVSLPGHSSDSVGIIFAEDAVIATGDIIFDRGSAMIYWPDGSLAQYFTTLDQLCTLLATMELTTLLPGHGEIITYPLAHLARYRQHRLERLEQVRSAIPSTGTDPDAIVRHVYGTIEAGLHDAARRTVQAQLQYLGKIK